MRNADGISSFTPELNTMAELELPSPQISILLKIMKMPVQEPTFGLRRLSSTIVANGWAMRADIEDLFYCSDPRLERTEIDLWEFVSGFKITPQVIYTRPKRLSNSTSGLTKIRASEAAFLMMQCERLGFRTDAQTLCKALERQLKEAQYVTEAELAVLWFEKMRHKQEEFIVQSPGHEFAWKPQESLKLDTGYRVDVFGKPDEVTQLIVYAPKYRRRPKPKQATCSECGWSWLKGDPDSSAAHRSEHRKRMAVLNPQPSKRLLSLDLNTNVFAVEPNSATWMHNEVYKRALMFRREMHFDFVQWASPSSGPDKDAVGFLLSDEQFRIVGALAFRQNPPQSTKNWRLSWVWIAPNHRRKKVFSNAWPIFTKRFGHFDVETPISDAMASFLKRNEF